MGINIHTGIMVILTNYVFADVGRLAKSRGILVHKFLSTGYIQQGEDKDEKIRNDLQ